MKRKSKAQIKRNQKRAEARGEVYEPPVVVDESRAEETDVTTSAADDPKRKAAEKLRDALKALEDTKELKAKDRRSERRKAMAIAAEESGLPAEELLEWLNNQENSSQNLDKNRTAADNSEHALKPIPYIAFIGQLSFTTTKEMLFDHIRQALAGEKFKITHETLRIRLLTDAKTKKSRGMAFVEVDDPEILYALLKLHHTMLNNRRINVERSAGGGKEGKKEKINQFRKEQQEYMLNQVKQIMQEYIDRKDIAEGELDSTAILVCTRHSPVIVQAALDAYVEKRGREMDNPSAYFTFLISKLAEEGVIDKKSESQRYAPHGQGRKRPRAEREAPGKGPTNSLQRNSNFAKGGIDMSSSEPVSDIALIFPSAKRGRGRGR